MLLAWKLTTNGYVALIFLTFQIGLVLDFVFKRLIGFEPLHTFLAMVFVWLLSLVFSRQLSVYVLGAYFSHLFLDLFVDEPVPLLWPFEKIISFPIKGSEWFVIVLSIAGSVLVLLI
ncbi:hypothetical protein D6825_01965 [Candidatus Woesearchaeota archaeon]|nr:MAG: hypothetical protein D6825_01965 [Candidatus Woesearchaeota archaeon]